MKENKIYEALDKIEKIAIRIAKINGFVKKDRKKRLKQDKKLGKLNKKTGLFVLKKLKHQKGARFHKRLNIPNN